MIDEGVVKYRVKHSKEHSPKFLEYPAAEQVRAHLVALGLIGESKNVGYGNLSVRDTLTSGFFITATQTGALPSLLTEHYSYVRRYNFDTFTICSQGEHQPSSEALSHAMIYDIHPDISAVIHVHSLALWRHMQEEDYLATNAPYGTQEMVREIAALYNKHDPFTHNAFVMKGHQEGIITFGRSLEEAQLRLYALLKCYLLRASHHTHKASVRH